MLRKSFHDIIDFQVLKTRDLQSYLYYLTLPSLPAPRQALGHYRGDSLTNTILITAFLQFDLKVTGILVTELGSQCCTAWHNVL